MKKKKSATVIYFFQELAHYFIQSVTWDFLTINIKRLDNYHKTDFSQNYFMPMSNCHKEPTIPPKFYQLNPFKAQEKSRELSMLTVDNRQLQYRLDKLEADYRQESEKVSAH